MTYHTFVIEDMKRAGSVAAQLAAAVKVYRDRWKKDPATVAARDGTPIPPLPGLSLDIARVPALPAGYWYFEVDA